jgi:hypothetical protein
MTTTNLLLKKGKIAFALRRQTPHFVLTAGFHGSHSRSCGFNQRPRVIDTYFPGTKKAPSEKSESAFFGG